MVEGGKAIGAKTQLPISVVDRNVDPIIHTSEFYGGCYAICKVNAYAWEYKNKKGVSFGLGNIQKIKDGERLGGGPSDPTKDFKPINSEKQGIFG